MFKFLGNLVKRTPHPSYGNYGGYYRRCKNRKQKVCPEPIDWMDKAFQDYDKGMSNKDLVETLMSGKPSKLRHPFYGYIYRWGAIGVFSLANLFGG